MKDIELAGVIELPEDVMAQLKQIAALPDDDIKGCIKVAGVTRAEFQEFMDEHGLWDDAEYAEIGRRVLNEIPDAERH